MFYYEKSQLLVNITNSAVPSLARELCFVQIRRSTGVEVEGMGRKVLAAASCLASGDFNIK